jgi:hypothetical protein
LLGLISGSASQVVCWQSRSGQAAGRPCGGGGGSNQGGRGGGAWRLEDDVDLVWVDGVALGKARGEV